MVVLESYLSYSLIGPDVFLVLLFIILPVFMVVYKRGNIIWLLCLWGLLVYLFSIIFVFDALLFFWEEHRLYVFWEALYNMYSNAYNMAIPVLARGEMTVSYRTAIEATCRVFAREEIYSEWARLVASVSVDFRLLLLKLFLIAIFTIIFCVISKKERMPSVEFYWLLFGVKIAGLLIISANDLITLYIALEIMALCSYGLVAFNGESHYNTEAALKYFVINSIGSLFVVFGAAFVYYCTGSINFSEIYYFMRVAESTIYYQVACIFIIIGILIKIGGAPFHWAIADIYEGAEISITLLLSTYIKAVYIFLLIVLTSTVFVDHMCLCKCLLTTSGIGSISIGTVAALYQEKIKRLFAYSGITNVGFILLMIGDGTWLGIGVAVTYTVAYILTTMAVFLVFVTLPEKELNITSFFGWYKNGAMPIVMVLAILSVVGFPVSLLFFAKLDVINVLIFNHRVPLAICILALQVISWFYYLRLIRNIFIGNNIVWWPVVNEKILKYIIGIVLFVFFGALSLAFLDTFCGALTASLMC